MDGATASLLGSALALAGTVIVGVYVARKGKQSTDQSTQVAFIEKLLARVESLEAQVQRLWDARGADALIKRAAGDHIDALEDHIRKQLPPPPPPRPPGV